jgi:hypothetical protein
MTKAKAQKLYDLAVRATADFSATPTPSECTAQEDALWAAREQALKVLHDASVKALRPNAWLKTFLKSLASLPAASTHHGARLSSKQAHVLANALAFEEQTARSSTYKGRYDGIMYSLSLYQGAAILTIRPDLAH